jgi:hypothetical protein
MSEVFLEISQVRVASPLESQSKEPESRVISSMQTLSMNGFGGMRRKNWYYNWSVPG